MRKDNTQNLDKYASNDWKRNIDMAMMLKVY